MKITEVSTKKFWKVLQVVCKDVKEELQALVKFPRFLESKEWVWEERICYFWIEKHEAPDVFDDSDYLYD